MSVVLSVTNAVKSFGGNKALDNVSLELRKGEWQALLGPNGAGKTTLLKSITGRVRLDSGTIALPGSKGDILGIVPQEIALYPRLTAMENLRAFGELLGVTGVRLREQVHWAMEFTGLTDRRSDLVGSFSGGMKRRLNIACGVLHRPPIVLLDEPTVGVDPQSRERIWEMLEQLRREGASLLLTTHQLDEAQQICDRIVVIDHGRVIASGTFDELLRDTIGAERRVSLLLDSPERAAAFKSWPGTTVDGAAVRCLVRETGAGVVDVRVETPSLQAVFIHLTGRELRDS
jgi:ABC-2 type transport system ATP-binding protein